MSFLSEFKSFALKRNALDLAIGVVIGASFQSVVDALVNNLLMPPIRALSGTLPGEAWELTWGNSRLGLVPFSTPSFSLSWSPSPYFFSSRA